MGRRIRPATPGDALAIADVYNHYVCETMVSFETEPVSPRDMAARMEGCDPPWLVCEDAGNLHGYAYAKPWNPRAAYRHSVETSIYLHHAHTGRGIGRALYEALVDELRRRPIHRVLAGIALPNRASVALHESLGFAKVAHFPEVGRKFGRWIDVGYWSLALDNPDDGDTGDQR